MPKLYPTKAVLPAKKKRYPVKAVVRVTTATKVASKGGILEVLRIPKKPKVRHTTRTKLKQTKMPKGAKPQKLAAIVLPDKNVPSLSRVLEWANNTIDRNHLSEILANYPTIMDDDFMNSRVARSKRDHVYADNYNYNFVIPKNLVLKLDAVVKAEKKKRSMSNYFNQTADDNHPERTTEEIIAYFPGGTPQFTSAAVYRMNEFYNVVRKLDAWKEDVDWLMSTKWDEMTVNPELFDVETDSDELTDDTTGAKHAALANEVLKQLEGASLSSIFRLESGEGTVKLDKMVGMLARKEMLSDTIIDFAIRCICDALGDCYALDTYAATFRCPDPPQTRISSMHYVVSPVHLSNIRWGVIIVSITYQTEPPAITPYFYEPLCDSRYRATMEDTYEETVAPFLLCWHEKTMTGVEYPVVENGVWLDAPRQPDGTSCGVMVIAQVYCMLKDNFRFTNTTVSDDDVAIMRLRIMWMILMQPEVSTVANQVAKTVDATDLELMATVTL
ncbi:hypothetical protein PF008_g8655 [Phytophthora fragariae]|uniref:Ubiquitin-like protease family profile domain-containing protein n=1 Tax=Phytophthora fragariae TaxID=53985 RepID=A0A6G0RZ37_9STRA|nr:hypothetical protein PF008_g8655 [Phytophthora fragariae]